MSRMHANTSTYDTHLIVISYLHTVTYCMYVLLSVLASLRVKNTYPSIIEDALSTYVSFVFSPIFLNFLLEDHCFSSNQPQQTTNVVDALEEFPPRHVDSTEVKALLLWYCFEVHASGG